MPWGAAIVAAGALGGAALSSDASKSAANTQAQATQAGINSQVQQSETARMDTAPYRAAGANSMGALQSILGLNPTTPTGGFQWNGNSYADEASLRLALEQNYTKESGGRDPNNPAVQNSIDSAIQQMRATQPSGAPAASSPDSAQQNSPLTRKFSISDFWNDPVVQASYQSGLDLGTKALKNAAPLTTGLDSGAAMKELTKFGTDYTGNMAAGSQARFVGDQANTFNKLAAMAGIGQTSVGQATAAGTNTANNVSQLLTGNANAQGAARIAGANAFGGGLNSVANYWQQQQMMNNLKGNNTGGTTGYTPSQNPDWYAG